MSKKYKYSLKAIYFDFKGSIDELCYMVKCLSVQKKNIYRDTHIEGCFIRLVVSWENFIEEYFLRCMCKAKTRKGKVIKPKIIPFRSTGKAFKRINKKRAVRQKDYADWLDHKNLKQRIEDFFHKKSRLNDICESPDRLYSLVTIRNTIVHGSKSSMEKFKTLAINEHGFLRDSDPSAADLLITKKRSTSKLIFIDLSEYFLMLADKLTL
jgi:hypothetical protein